MLNFRVIDGEYHIIPPETYEMVKKDFCESKLSVVEIMDKYDISQNKWNKIRKQILKELNASRRPTGKHYHYNSKIGKFIVTKTLDNARYYYGYYDTEREVQLLVKELEKVNWDKKELPAIKQRLGAV